MGQLFYCCHLSSRSQRSPRWIEKSKAELLSKECGFPSYSPWQFDCSTWHIPSSGHSGLVDHGYRHILLGTVLIPVETQVSSVLLHQHSDPPLLSFCCREQFMPISELRKFKKEPRWTRYCYSMPIVKEGTWWLPLTPSLQAWAKVLPFCSYSIIYDKGDSRRRGRGWGERIKGARWKGETGRKWERNRG